MATALTCQSWNISNNGSIKCDTGYNTVELTNVAVTDINYDEAFMLEIGISLTMGFTLYLSGWVLLKPIEMAINFARSF
jgi:hypothetical protein